MTEITKPIDSPVNYTDTAVADTPAPEPAGFDFNAHAKKLETAPKQPYISDEELGEEAPENDEEEGVDPAQVDREIAQEKQGNKIIAKFVVETTDVLFGQAGQAITGIDKKEWQADADDKSYLRKCWNDVLNYYYPEGTKINPIYMLIIAMVTIYAFKAITMWKIYKDRKATPPQEEETEPIPGTPPPPPTPQKRAAEPGVISVTETPVCQQCNGKLKERQKRFCSNTCKNTFISKQAEIERQKKNAA